MKTLIAVIATSICLSQALTGGDAYSITATNILVLTNDADYGGSMETNLVSFTPFARLANIHDMLRTNGLECWVNILSRVPTRDGKPLLRPPVCWVYVYNHSTNDMGSLRMPSPYICRIALLNKQGNQVQKSQLGETYGGALSQDQIELWRRHWSDRRQSMFISFYRNSVSNFSDIPTEICNFSLKDVFQIEKPGDYELHLQMRLVQIGKDVSGKVHYPVTWLPEVVAKVQITPEDIH